MRRTIALLSGAILAVGVATWGSSANAQEAPRWQSYVPAPTNAFELKLGTGYTQGIGNIAPGTSIINVAGAGIGFSGDLDYRFSPYASVGVESQYQEFTTENNTGSRGLAFNLGVTVHAAPYRRADPFLRLGTGYRLLWDVNPISAPPNTTNLFHGFDTITGKLGVDIRVSKDVALAPVIGADLQVFVWENSNALSTAQLGTFVYGGLQGRFDVGGSTPETPIAKNR
jgi:hypothetical protein